MEGNSRYRNILESIKQTDEELIEARRRADDANRALAEVEPELEKTKRSLRKALIAGNQKEIFHLEGIKAELEQKRRSKRLLVNESNQKKEDIEARVKDLQREKNETFGELLRAWLKSEIKKYDSAAKDAMIRKERLILAHSLAKERGLSEISTSEIGSALAYLSKVGIPILEGFDSISFNVSKKASVKSSEIEEEILQSGE